MTIKNYKKLRQKTLLTYGVILLIVFLAYLILIIVEKNHTTFTHILAVTVLIIVLGMLRNENHKIKKSLLNKRVRIIQNQYYIPYPQKFSDSMIDLGRIFKNYRYKRHVIPEYLIEFREGNTLYLYQMVHDVSNENYKILRTNKLDVALVMDENNKKRILHLGNVEFVD